MKKSIIEQGQMFVYLPEKVFAEEEMPTPKVYVKVCDCEDIDECSVFVENNVMIKVAIGKVKKMTWRDKWNITDGFYGAMVRNGRFVPFEDLNEVWAICEESGYPQPEKVDLG